MFEILFWIYALNATFLMNHEIDAAYWREWKLFKLPMGISGDLVIHFPLIFFFLYGATEVCQHTFFGLVISLLLCIVGISAFSIHMYYLRKGRKEFKTPISLLILWGVFILSLIQGGITIYLLTT